MTECINDACTQACTTECRAVIAAAYERLREASGHPVPAPAPQLRDQVAAAIYEYRYGRPPQDDGWNGAKEDYSRMATAVLAVPAIQQLQAAVARVAELADEYPVHIDTALVHEALDPQPPARRDR